MLKNAYLHAKIGVDPAENEPRMASDGSWPAPCSLSGHELPVVGRLLLVGARAQGLGLVREADLIGRRVKIEE